MRGAGVIVDAVFGTGFAGSPRGPAVAAIETMNEVDAPVVATDIASGVNASTGEVEGVAVAADVTVTFHAPKLGHWIAPGKEHTGAAQGRADRHPGRRPGRAEGGPDRLPGARSWRPARAAGSTKFSSGQVVIVGGSRGLTGAVCMAALAAIRTGAGYATVAVPADLEQILEIKLTEVMSLGCASRDGRLRPAASEQILGATERAACVVLGSGHGTRAGHPAPDPGAHRADRGAAGDRRRRPQRASPGGIERLAERRAPFVLTPHAGEMGRLLEPGLQGDRGEAGRERARGRGAERGRSSLLKGDDTIVTDGERLAVNAISSPQLATAGTGRRPLRDDRGADRSRDGAVRRHLRARWSRTPGPGAAAGSRVGHDSVIAGDVIESIPAGLAL